MTDKPDWLENCLEISPMVEFYFYLDSEIVHNYAQSRRAQVHTSMKRDHPVHDLPVVGDPPRTGIVPSALALNRKERLLDHYKQVARLAIADEQHPAYRSTSFTLSLTIVDQEKSVRIGVPYCGEGYGPEKNFLLSLSSNNENGVIADDAEEGLEIEIYAEPDCLYIKQSGEVMSDDADHYKIDRARFREHALPLIERMDAIIAYLSQGFGADFWTNGAKNQTWPEISP